MDLKFFLVEDDPVSRKMLRNLLEDSDLGQVVGEAEDGSEVTVQQLRGVDIILIDLLMPNRDGIETIRYLKTEGYRGKFIMISQIENKQMVGEAYLVGVEYFIHKPINRLEVQAVLKRVIDSIRLTQSLQTIRESLSVVDSFSDKRKGISENAARAAGVGKRDQFSASYDEVVGQIGLRGETGAGDIERCLIWMQEASQRGETLENTPTLNSLYMNALGTETQNLRDIKAMEQRIRRAVFSVLTHLASLGLSDFGNPTFEYYAPRLFEFHEVRQRMKELESEQAYTKCKVNIRKFLFSLYAELMRGT